MSGQGRRLLKGFGVAAFIAVAAASASTVPAEAARYVARCVATPWCRITCTSNVTTVACYATILQNGRCFKRCMRAR